MTLCSLLAYYASIIVCIGSAASLKLRIPDSVWKSSGVLLICNSQSSYGCEYYVHSTKLASQLGKLDP